MMVIPRHICRYFVRVGVNNDKGIPPFKYSAVCCTLSRTYTSKSFNINDIALSNLENKSIDGTKRLVKPKKTKKFKAETFATKVPEKNIVVNTVTDDTDLPDWLGTLMDSPLYPEAVINPDQHQQFKEFVEELDLKCLPSVSTVIKKTEPKAQAEVLRKWQERKTKELGGEKQFQEYRQNTLDKGLNLHRCIQLQLSGETEIPVREQNKGHWQSLQRVLQDVSDVKLMEEECVHPEVFYRGKFDCIAQYRGTLCLIEWKTSSKLKPLLSNTYDNPLQVAAYMGAINRSNMVQRCGVPRLTNGAIVIAYPNGEPATVHLMNQKVCARYWRQWLVRLCQYWAMFYEEIDDK